MLLRIKCFTVCFFVFPLLVLQYCIDYLPHRGCRSHCALCLQRCGKWLWRAKYGKSCQWSELETKKYDNVPLSVCVSQAGELLQEVEEKVQKSIEMNYGNKEKEKLTSVWDNTMKEVLCPFIFLGEKFVIYMHTHVFLIKIFKTNVLNYFTFCTFIKLSVVTLFFVMVIKNLLH